MELQMDLVMKNSLGEEMEKIYQDIINMLVTAK